MTARCLALQGQRGVLADQGCQTKEQKNFFSIFENSINKFFIEN